MLTCIMLAGVLTASIELTAPETRVNWNTMEQETVVPTKSYLVPLEGVTAIAFTVDGRPDLRVKFEYIDNGEYRYWELWVPIEPGVPLTLTEFLATCPKEPS